MRVELYKRCRLPVVIDLSSPQVSVTHWTYDITDVTVHKISQLKRFFLNAVMIFTDIVYLTAWLTRAVNRGKDNIRIKLSAINPFFVGVEFPRTKPVVNKQYARVLEVVEGEALVILYPYKIVDHPYSFESVEDSVFMIRLSEANKLVIPPEWVYCVVNIGETPLVFIEIHNKKQPKNTIETKKRLPPFIPLVRNEKLEIVKNPSYRYVSNFVLADPSFVSRRYHLTPRSPLITQYFRGGMRFNWLLEPSEEFFEDFDKILLEFQIDEDQL